MASEELFDSPDGLSRRRFLGTTGSAVAGATLAGLGSPASTSAQAAKPAPRPSLLAAREAVAAIRPTILKISREVWAKPAVGLKEQEAMEVHIRELQAAGFSIVSRKSGGHPTAFVAEWSLGKGGPKIGFLPEYDALPGLGNAAVPRFQPTEDGVTDGHGCGHNSLGAGCTGAAMALKAMMERTKTPGTIRVYGCGAEENVGAKIFMAKAGLFNDLDAALAWHSAPMPLAGTASTTANRKITIGWQGKSAHAGFTPWQGRSALDAAELFAHGVNLMREHVEPTARLHYIYTKAGVAPNVVPDVAEMSITARDATTPKVAAIAEWLEQLAQGAALGTQTKVDFHLALGLTEIIMSEPIALRIYEHMQNTPLQWSDEEQQFAKSIQKEMGLAEKGMATQVAPFLRNVSAGGSSDLGDVSWNTPLGVFGWPTIPLDVSLHTWATTACGGMTIGDKGSVQSAEILAAVGMDLMTDPELRAAAKAGLAKSMDGRKYEAVLSDRLLRELDAAEGMIKGASDEFVDIPKAG
jgi:aminobenzoyl-glutamate utilization protein B